VANEHIARGADTPDLGHPPARDGSAPALTLGERLRAALDSMLDPHVLLTAVRDDHGHIVDFVYADANQAACAYDDMTYDELVGARLLDLMPGHASSGLLAQYANVVETGEPLMLDDVEYEQELLHGRPRYYDIRAVRVGDGLSYTWRDVTERHRAAAALAASEERYRMVAENVSDVIVYVRDGTVTWISPSVERTLGGSPEDWLGRTLSDFVHPDDLVAVSSTETLSAVDGSLVLRARVRGEDGAYHWVEGSVAPYVDARGAVDGAIASLRLVDIEAEMHRLNEELGDRVLQRTADLEAANRELEAFIYAAAHDLRTPLRAIDGFSAVVAEDAAERLSDADRDNLRRVRRAAQTMGRLIDHLVVLSGATSRELQVERVDVTALATDVAAEVCTERAGRDLELIVAPGVTADADAVLLRVILTALLDNACKFTSTHPSARIEVGALELGGEQVLFVRDDGVGFDAANARHLFGPFQRYHAKEEFPGDGIGLATVKRLVARHGGRVWAESSVGRGAVFFFSLRARR
jgi:PAS domain S-box-containing protein